MRIVGAGSLLLSLILAGCSSPVASSFLGLGGDPELANTPGPPKLRRETEVSPAVAAAVTASSDATKLEAGARAHDCMDHTFYGPVVTKCAGGDE